MCLVPFLNEMEFKGHKYRGSVFHAHELQTFSAFTTCNVQKTGIRNGNHSSERLTHNIHKGNELLSHGIINVHL